MLTKEHIFLAYKKLKQDVYYDKNDLILRFKLAEYECQKGFPNWKKILDVLEWSEDFTDSPNPALNLLLNRISCITIPKSFKPGHENISDTPKYLTNINVSDKYVIEKVNYHIDAPIELHILSTLWCMYVGVLIDKCLSSNCYGYRLHYNLRQDDDKSGDLFKFYPEQYSAWRDSGIEKAKILLGDKEDVAILGLDISQFYYSVNFNFAHLRDFIQDQLVLHDYNSEYIDLLYRLTNVVEHICTVYNNKIKFRKELTHKYAAELTLPLGMSFSPILANWYIRDFDNAVEEYIKPAYYGRYVDDMLLVLVNPIIEKDHPVENFIRRYFVNTGILKEDQDEKYTFINQDGLCIQKKKLILQYFDKDFSRASLEKFVKKINKNSSEFRYLPEDNIDEKFDEVAFDLLYKGSPNKLSSVIGVTENKYELAKFLGCKISLLVHSGHKPDSKSNSDLIRFFSGRTGLEYFSLWERCLTYLLISRSFNEAYKLTRSIASSIKRILFEGDTDNVTTNAIRDYLFKHLFHSLCMPFGLMNTIPENFNELLKKIHFKESYDEFIQCIRQSNMLRHYHIARPLLSYTKYNDDFTQPVDLYPNKFSLDRRKIQYSPRFIHIDEYLTYMYYTQLHEMSPREQINVYREIFGGHQNNEYDDINCELIRHYCGRDDTEICPKDGSYWQIKVKCGDDRYKEHIKIGIVNLFVNYPDIENSFKRTPNITIGRRQQLNSILNLATKEQCNLLILPELSIPFDWLQDLIYHARNRQIGLVFGLEYYVDENGYAYNYLATILPFIDSIGRKSCFPRLRLKKHYALYYSPKFGPGYKVEDAV